MILLSISILTTLIGIFGLGVIGAKWGHSKHDDFLFGIGLFFAVTAMFGLANALDLQLDYILYPIRLAVMAWCLWALIKK